MSGVITWLRSAPINRNLSSCSVLKRCRPPVYCWLDKPNFWLRFQAPLISLWLTPRTLATFRCVDPVSSIPMQIANSSVVKWHPWHWGGIHAFSSCKLQLNPSSCSLVLVCNDCVTRIHNRGCETPRANSAKDYMPLSVHRLMYILQRHPRVTLHIYNFRQQVWDRCRSVRCIFIINFLNEIIIQFKLKTWWQPSMSTLIYFFEYMFLVFFAWLEFNLNAPVCVCILAITLMKTLWILLHHILLSTNNIFILKEGANTTYKLRKSR